MIERFTDHAANERTYLAWVRTALALIAGGFVIERFDLSLAGTTVEGGPGDGLLGADVAGLVLILLGIAVVAAATTRYFRYRRLIADSELHRHGRPMLDLIMVGVVLLVGLYMGYFVARNVLP